MKIAQEIIEKLQVLKGINLDIAFTIFKQNKLDVKEKGFVENLIALLLDKNLPKNYRGMDFKGLFEVKEIKVNFTKKSGFMRTGGDTSISAYLRSEPEFFESNIWDKSKSILIVCVDQNRIVVDVRFFDGETHAEQMRTDYEGIKNYGNLCRKNNKILVFKTGRNSIMMKGNIAIDMSESILELSNFISDQKSYIHNKFGNKFSDYQKKKKKIEKISQTNLDKYIKFDLNAGQELCF